MSERDTAALTLQASSASPADILRSEDASLRDRKGNPAPDATLSSFGREGLIMTNRRGSTTASLVPAKTGEQLFSLGRLVEHDPHHRSCIASGLTARSSGGPGKANPGAYPPADRDDRRAQRSRRGRRAEGDQTTTHAAGL